MPPLLEDFLLFGHQQLGRCAAQLGCNALAGPLLEEIRAAQAKLVGTAASLQSRPPPQAPSCPPVAAPSPLWPPRCLGPPTSSPAGRLADSPLAKTILAKVLKFIASHMSVEAAAAVGMLRRRPRPWQHDPLTWKMLAALDCHLGELIACATSLLRAARGSAAAAS